LAYWNGDLDNPHDRNDVCNEDVESDIEQVNRIENLESPERRDVRAAPHVPSLIRHKQKSKRHVEMVLVVAVNAIEISWNKGVTKM
jgi:hypothetical protein